MTNKQARRILIAGGTSWYLWNFRRNVIGALAARGIEVVVVAPEDEYSERLAALPGVRWLDWPMDLDGANPLRELATLVRFVRLARRVRPDLVLNHGIKANVYGGLACRLLSIPYANSVTGLGMALTKPGPMPRALARLYAFASSRARALLVQNLDDLAVLRKAGLSSGVPVVRTMGSGVDLDRFSFAPMPQGNGRTFLFVGRLQRDKGIGEFVEAARTVRAAIPETRFVAAGSGRFANRGAVAGELLMEWKREGVVEFVGHQEDVRPWLANAHALVLPSHGGEGIPRAILEAAATGRPTVASDVSGSRDAVVHGQTGYLHTARDREALIEAMLVICRTSTEDLASMGKAARMDAEARFSDARIIEAVIELVEASP